MKVAVYADRDVFERGVGDNPYLYEALRASFDTSLYWEADAGLCSDADVVFCRYTRTRPQPRDFLRQLSRCRNKLIVNHPVALLRFGSKRHLLHFPHLTAPTIMTRSHERILEFARMHGTIVIKPMNSHSGKGTVKLDTAGMCEDRLRAVVEDHIGRHGTPVVQQYIDRVQEWGDKRINVVGYRAVSAVRTLPAPGSFICHRAAGGREVAAELTEEDAAIVRQILPFLERNGIWWAGIDLIGPYLGEINIVSPMMIRRADIAHGNTDGIEALIDSLRNQQIAYEC